MTISVSLAKFAVIALRAVDEYPILDGEPRVHPPAAAPRSQRLMPFGAPAQTTYGRELACRHARWRS